MMRFARAWSAPIITGLVLLALWEGLLAVTDPDGFVLPPPSKILAAVGENWDEIYAAAKVTGFIIITGLIVGVVVGVVAAMAVTAMRLAREVITPLAVAISAVPIIAVAPILNNWFGLLSPRSNQAIVAMLVFFPIFINTSKGLTQVEDSQIELMDSYAASKWQIMREVRIPNALPFLFTSLKLASSLAVIAAIVAEYFGGRQDSLGLLITSAAGLARYDDAWAAVLAGSIIGMMLYIVVVVAERLAIPWHSSVRERHSIPGG